jgi:hypothetical protein|tara:strand:- start:941 stop:1168 length:228 start_codon:yes stop_codon:yes gene_type:complete
MNNYDNKCKITCTDNDIVNEAEVDRFEDKKFVEVFIAQNRIKLLWNGSVYVGNKSGLEFTTKGPTIYEVKQGRGI